jgi:hypothetical protein
MDVGPNFFLVLFLVLVKVTITMKRLFTLIVLLGFVGLLAGCNESTSTAPASTNAPPAMPSTTNK